MQPQSQQTTAAMAAAPAGSQPSLPTSSSVIPPQPSQPSPSPAAAAAAAAAAAGGGGLSVPGSDTRPAGSRPTGLPSACGGGSVTGSPPLLPRSRSNISVASVLSIVPSEADEAYSRHVLVAVDNSANSCTALSWAAEHMYRHGDKFHLVHIIPEPPTLHPWPGVYIPPDDALEREEFKDAAAMIRAAFAPIAARRGIPCVVHLIVAPDDPGSIAAIVTEKQQQLDAAVLVVAPHGRSGLAEWWLGSVTKGLLKHSAVPVAVVPPDMPAPVLPG